MKNFVIIGVAGYVAPRHLKAIKETGNNLVAALDKSDSVGILDKYFPNCDFFTEFERFDRYCEKLKRVGTVIDYVIVCTPNYLHDAHIRFGLRIGANVICEKPVVLNTWNATNLLDLEKEFGKKIFCILQLRNHSKLIALKKHIDENPTQMNDVNIEYITPRGNWYAYSWKGNQEKSGGIIKNIGIHILDLLCWLFGTPNKIEVENISEVDARFRIEFIHAKVNCNLNIEKKNDNELPKRIINVNNQEIALENEFNDLHTICYQKIIENKGTTLVDAIPSLILASQILKEVN